jgi:hypothetical protein
MTPYSFTSSLLLVLIPILYPAIAVPGSPSRAPATGPERLVQEQAPLVRVLHDRLTIALQDVPWAVVLGELERQASVTFRVQGRLDGTVTEAFEALPLDKGLRRLLRHADFIFLYTELPHGQGAESRLVQVWIMPRGKGNAGHADTTQPRPQVLQPADREGEGPPASVIRGGITTEQSEDREHPVGDRATGRGPQAREALIRALQDPDAGVRENAVSALADGKDTDAIEYLRQTLVADASEDVRGSAAETLAEIATTPAIGALRLALQDKVAVVRRRAVAALGTIEGTEAIEALQDALRDQDEDVRDAAAEALQQWTEEPSSD